MSDPAVSFGCAAVKNTADERAWSAPSPFSTGARDMAFFSSVLLITVTCSRSRSSGASVWVNSKSRPSLAGDQ
jgi:hypothetical protein